jgi:hypothetical protein
MKTLKYFIVAGVMLISFGSCKKEAGFEGKKEIFGTVTAAGEAVEGAIVYIAFDTKEATETFNSSTVTDASGNYRFYALSKGNYFLDAKHTCSKGMNFNTPGVAVEIGSKKGELQVDIALQ